MFKRVLLIGSGSIANKHLFNLQLLNIDVIILISKEKEIKRFDYVKNIKFIYKIEDIKNYNIDFCLIANSTHNHYTFIKRLIRLKINIYCEKPIGLDVIKLKNLRNRLIKNKIIYQTGYHFKEHNFYKFIKKKIKTNKIISVSLRVGQNLNLWRKNKIRNKSYYLDSKSGGGVIYELIHDVNLINCLFGNIKYINTIKKKSQTFKKIEDLAISNFITSKKIYGSIYQDMLSPVLFRNLEIVTESKNYYFDFVKNFMKITSKKKERIKYIKKKQDQMALLRLKILNMIRNIKKKIISTQDFDQSIFDLMICKKMHKNNFKEQ